MSKRRVYHKRNPRVSKSLGPCLTTDAEGNTKVFKPKLKQKQQRIMIDQNGEFYVNLGITSK